MDVEALTQALQARLFVELEASARHVHLTAQAAQTLFGHGLTPQRPLSQHGQFLCNERVTLITPKARLAHVAVLGPERSSCQVELSMTDCVALGLHAPVRLSGSIDGTTGIVIACGERSLALDRGVIVAKRHIHMTLEDAARHGVSDGESVRLRTLTARPLVFEDVIVRVSRDFQTYAHLDLDEANACGFRRGDLGMILHG